MVVGTVADLGPSAPQHRQSAGALVTDALAERCRAFTSGRRYNPNHVAFVHVWKAGGTSFRNLLFDQSKRAGRPVAWPWESCLAREHAFWQPSSLDQCRAETQRAHTIEASTYAFVSAALNWRNGSASFVTLLREPGARLESTFRYQGGRGKEFVEDVRRRNGSLQDEFDRYLLSGEKMHAPWLHAPPALWREAVGAGEPWTQADGSGRSRSTRSRGMVPEMDPQRTQLSVAQVAQLGRFVTKRFSVTGVLERPADTLEVMRCRVPWFSATEFPDGRAYGTAQSWHYPLELRRNRSHVERAAATELQLYELANTLLSADLECCRRAEAAVSGTARARANTAAAGTAASTAPSKAASTAPSTAPSTVPSTRVGLLAVGLLRRLGSTAERESLARFLRDVRCAASVTNCAATAPHPAAHAAHSLWTFGVFESLAEPLAEPRAEPHAKPLVESSSGSEVNCSAAAFVAARALFSSNGPAQLRLLTRDELAMARRQCSSCAEYFLQFHKTLLAFELLEAAERVLGFRFDVVARIRIDLQARRWRHLIAI